MVGEGTRVSRGGSAKSPIHFLFALHRLQKILHAIQNHYILRFIQGTALESLCITVTIFHWKLNEPGILPDDNSLKYSSLLAHITL